MKAAFAPAAIAFVIALAPQAVAQQAVPAEVTALMKSVVIPASDMVFAVGKAAPKSDAEWATVQNAAARLGDAGRQLASRAPAANSADWVKFAKAMADAAAVAGTAAQAKNIDAVLDAGDALYETCAGCHQRFMKK
jgi:cytochrome c556